MKRIFLLFCFLLFETFSYSQDSIVRIEIKIYVQHNSDKLECTTFLTIKDSLLIKKNRKGKVIEKRLLAENDIHYLQEEYLDTLAGLQNNFTKDKICSDNYKLLCSIVYFYNDGMITKTKGCNFSIPIKCENENATKIVLNMYEEINKLNNSF